MAVWILTSVLLLLTNHIGVFCEQLLTGAQENFENDGPGSEFEFKIDVGAGTEECFFQKIQQGAKLHVSFEVLQGGDLNIDFYFKDPYHNLVESHNWKAHGNIDRDVHVTGVYSICLDNSFSHFNNKLVYFYLVTFVPDQWAQYVSEISEIHGVAENVTDLLTDVQKSISEMAKFQSQSRFSVTRDWYLIRSNNSYVQIWSIVQCSVILATSLLTVYFVRRLFNVSNVTPTSKPRA